MVVKLICHNVPLESCRKEVLAAVQEQLCQHSMLHTTPGASDTADGAASGDGDKSAEASAASAPAAAAAASSQDQPASDIARRGWRLKPCHTEYFVRLEHQQLQLQLDVQVRYVASKCLFKACSARCHGTNSSHGVAVTTMQHPAAAVAAA